SQSASSGFPHVAHGVSPVGAEGRAAPQNEHTTFPAPSSPPKMSGHASPSPAGSRGGGQSGQSRRWPIVSSKSSQPVPPQVTHRAPLSSGRDGAGRRASAQRAPAL